jgi:hypothetical protein
MNNSTIQELYNKNIYTIEKNQYGHVIFILKEIIPGKISKEGRELFIQHTINTVNESLKISRLYGKKTAYVHIYLKDCSFKHFSLSLIKKITHILSTTFEDTLETMYIYSSSKLFSRLWNITKHFIDKDTLVKIKQIKN